MYKLNKPNLDIETFFLGCLPLSERNQKRINALAVKNEAIIKGQEYDEITVQGQIHTLEANEDYGILVDVYNGIYRGRAREKYDCILSSAKNNICPFCSHGIVSTVDHFLPKEKYTPYAILPFNMVPCCSLCNKNKLDYSPNLRETTILHPYYDNIDDIEWLKATCLYINDGYIINFFINPDIIDNAIYQRIYKHFELLKLGKTYTSQVAQEITVQSSYIKKMIMDQGYTAADVEEYLLSEAQKYLVLGKNTWKYTMYIALARNQNFCSAVNL